MPVHEHRNEIRDTSIAQQVLADTREFTMDKVRIELIELARNLGFGLPHPLLEVLVTLSHRDADLHPAAAAESSRAARRRMRRVGELAAFRGKQIRHLLADVDGVVADPLERA